MDLLTYFIVFFATTFSILTIFFVGFRCGFRVAAKTATDVLDEMIQGTKDELLAIRKERE